MSMANSPNGPLHFIILSTISYDEQRLHSFLCKCARYIYVCMYAPHLIHSTRYYGMADMHFDAGEGTS